MRQFLRSDHQRRNQSSQRVFSKLPGPPSTLLFHPPKNLAEPPILPKGLHQEPHRLRYTGSKGKGRPLHGLHSLVPTVKDLILKPVPKVPQQIVLSLEAGIEGTYGGIRPLDDVGDGGALHPRLLEQLQSGRNDPLQGLSASLLLRRPDPGRISLPL